MITSSQLQYNRSKMAGIYDHNCSTTAVKWQVFDHNCSTTAVKWQYIRPQLQYRTSDVFTMHSIKAPSPIEQITINHAWNKSGQHGLAPRCESISGQT